MLEIMWINIKVTLQITTVLYYQGYVGGPLSLQHIIQEAQQSQSAGGDSTLSWYNTVWKLKLQQISRFCILGIHIYICVCVYGF